jgi:hypothetical protein
MPKYIFRHDPDTGSLYLPFYQFFMERWNNPEIPEYDLETDQLIYRNTTGNEVRRESLETMDNKVFIKRDSLRHEIFKDRNKGENRSSLHSHTPIDQTPAGNSPIALRQNLHSGLHPGGKQFVMLRSRNPICEVAD